jgi:hypothetical protein
VGEIFINHISTKELVPRIYKELLQVKKKKSQKKKPTQFKNDERT